MSERKLTPEEIEELHEFCIYRSIWHYDVQVELVDHLASAIEDLWVNNSKLSFQDALYEVDKKFGSHLGFVVIRQEKEKALRKKYRRLLWHFVADFYKFPKIMVTLSFFLGIFMALRFTENDQWIVGSLLIMFIAFSLFYLLYYFPKFVRIKVPEKHSFLLNEITQKGIVYQTMMFSGGFISLVSHATNFSTTGSVVFSALVSLYLVLLYGDCFFIPKKIHEHFKEQFPQFQIA
ncbi:MAG: hypothetical protein Q8M67_04155 [Bacteroidota bacterium]|nr:hypothetical protein [Bacteroidota bacterium]